MIRIEANRLRLKATGIRGAFGTRHAAYDQRLIRVHSRADSNPKQDGEHRGFVSLANCENYD
jgi:hypothetical protein